MSHKSTKLSEDQEEYAQKLRRILREHRVALLQLPTGMGKTAIVMNVVREELTEGGWRVIFSMPRRWKVPGDGGRSDENGHNSDKGGRERKDSFELFPWLRRRDLQLAGYTDEHIKKLRADASNNPGKVTVTSHYLLSRKGGAKERLFIYSRGRGGRPIGLNRDLIRNKTVVVLDEVHRARGLLAKIARSELKRPPKNVWFVFVSATPVNPVSHDYLCNSLNVQMLDQREDREIRTGYLRLYRALVNLSHFTTRQYRESYTNKLSKSKKLEELAATLKEISDKLAVPTCEGLCKLKRKLRIRKRRPRSVASTDTIGAVERLVRFQLAVRAANGANTRNAVKKMGVLEHFAIAGALYPQKEVVEKVLSFPKGKHHNLSKTEYACDGLHKQHCSQSSGQINKMTYKLDRLREFLEQHLERKESGKVVIFCNYRRTAWWVSAWLEKNLNYKEPGKGSKEGVLEKLYGKMGKLRRVVDTVTYSSSKNQKEAAQSAAKDRELVIRFNSDKKSAMVLVTTDRLSESVDLHKQCDTLIHFDLGWSPLRMMQRVGRLWRYGAYNSSDGIEQLPPFPRVYHLRYPCSVDDEKYARLKRRWERLGELDLGLDFVPFEACVGEELGGWEREVQDWMAASRRSWAKEKALPVKNGRSEAALH